MPLSIKTVSELLKNNYQIFRAFTENNNYLDKFKNFKKFKTIIIVGMGGSILGSKAIYSFLKWPYGFRDRKYFFGHEAAKKIKW